MKRAVHEGIAHVVELRAQQHRGATSPSPLVSSSTSGPAIGAPINSAASGPSVSPTIGATQAATACGMAAARASAAKIEQRRIEAARLQQAVAVKRRA